MYNYTYLKDMEFLKYLTGLHINEFFAKIIVLNWKQNPIQEIQGKVISANFTIDGQSSVRRTGNLTLILDKKENNLLNINNLISINKKVKIQIGFKNFTEKYLEYHILWFPLGIYVITDPSISHSVDQLLISLQLKDKMCLLNGQCGGTIPASTVFDNYETVDQNGQYIIKRPTIYQIIRQLVNHFGGEQLGKIIISDLDTRVKQVMKWTGSFPLYFLIKEGQYFLTINGNEYIQKTNEGWEDFAGSPYEYGDDVGYIYTDFSYPGDLIADAGNSVVDILQKIKEILGNYEYFYDINGNFIFQQIKNYLNNSQSKYILESLKNPNFDFFKDFFINNDAYVIDLSNGKSIFQFNDGNLITSYSNNPLYSMIKNDFIIWGLKINNSGKQIPIRYHLAIDKKPKIGNTYYAFQYQDPNDGITKWHVPVKYSSVTDFPRPGVTDIYYMDTTNEKIYKWDVVNNTYDYILINVQMQRITTKDWRTQLYFQGVVAEPYGTDSNLYYVELKNEWPKIYDIKPDYQQNNEWKNDSDFKEEIKKDPSKIQYFLDFIDSTAEAGQFSIQNIGKRTLVINKQKDANCIFQPYIPDIILLSSQSIKDLREECQARGQDYYQVSDSIYANLSIGGSFNSAYQIIRQLIHQYTSYNNNISIQTLPIFFLEPNTRITVNDKDSNIFGDFMINSISFSLDTSSGTTINAQKALEKI